MDLGEVLPELSSLTFIEQQLISPVHAVISVYRVKGEQYAYSGHVILFPQDILEFYERLPRNPLSMDLVLIVQKSHQETTTISVYDEEMSWVHCYG